MSIVGMRDARTNLSKLVRAIEEGEKREIIISRNGRPVARLIPMKEDGAGPLRLGLAKGKFKTPVPDEEFDSEIARLFLGK